MPHLPPQAHGVSAMGAMDGMGPNNAAVKEAVLQACQDVGLPDSCRLLVTRLLFTPEADWPECCGTGCDPCTLVLGDAALRARKLLGRED